MKNSAKRDTPASSDIGRLREALTKDPHDWDLRLILADAYEEEGMDGRAAYQRWAALRRMSPGKWYDDDDSSWWMWVNGWTEHDSLINVQNGQALWHRWYARCRDKSLSGKYFPSLEECEESLRVFFEEEGYPG